MEKFLKACREYSMKIEECLKNNEWQLDNNFQLSLLDISILDVMNLPKVEFHLRQVVEMITVQGELAQNKCKGFVLDLLRRGDDSSMVLGTLLYMFMILRTYSNYRMDTTLLRLQLIMACLVKPEDLGAPIGSIGLA